MKRRASLISTDGNARKNQANNSKKKPRLEFGHWDNRPNWTSATGWHSSSARVLPTTTQYIGMLQTGPDRSGIQIMKATKVPIIIIPSNLFGTTNKCINCPVIWGTLIHPPNQAGVALNTSNFQSNPVPFATVQHVPNLIQQRNSITSIEKRPPVVLPNSNQAAVSTSLKERDNATDCAVCMDILDNPQSLPCSHQFCKICLDQLISVSKSHQCPMCRVPFRTAEGKQPKDGTMTVTKSNFSLAGYEGAGCIQITYNIPSGIQGPEHPNPGQRFQGTTRTAYLPRNTEGRKVERLLRKAFVQRLTFTVGRSITTGIDNSVVWNDIHHKTSMYGGEYAYGYPDPGYMDRVTEDLKAKGITE